MCTLSAMKWVNSVSGWYYCVFYLAWHFFPIDPLARLKMMISMQKNSKDVSYGHIMSANTIKSGIKSNYIHLEIEWQRMNKNAVEQQQRKKKMLVVHCSSLPLLIAWPSFLALLSICISFFSPKKIYIVPINGEWMCVCVCAPSGYIRAQQQKGDQCWDKHLNCSSSTNKRIERNPFLSSIVSNYGAYLIERWKEPNDLKFKRENYYITWYHSFQLMSMDSELKSKHTSFLPLFIYLPFLFCSCLLLGIR